MLIFEAAASLWKIRDDAKRKTFAVIRDTFKRVLGSGFIFHARNHHQLQVVDAVPRVLVEPVKQFYRVARLVSVCHISVKPDCAKLLTASRQGEPKMNIFQNPRRDDGKRV